MNIDIHKAFAEVSQEKDPYFRQYTHDAPMIMSHETYFRTKQLGEILHKAIGYFVENYRSFLHVMPLDERTLEILEICGKYPFRIGAYRTDFVINKQREIKIIEMTTRFPLNGYMGAGFLRNIGRSMADTLKLNGIIDDYSRFLNFLQNDFAPTGKITVIKGKDRMNDFKLYSLIFPKANIDFRVIELDELEYKIDILKGACVIGELNQQEIKSLTNRHIDALVASGIYNDFRNIFLVHDKRFFKLLTDPVFLDAALSAEEQKILSTFTIPSYTLPGDKAFFEEAYARKDNWILKPHLLGKGEGVMAGQAVSEEEWKKLFETEQVQSMILQHLVEQPLFPGTIGQEIRNDYVVGTLLYFDNDYYGPGEYRASSFCVTNQGDHRKVAQIVAEREERLADITI
ncbi:MAG: hypothetical protein LBS04_05810 [Tannerellaceae bacterium]|jgi:hypothetical protein|nr:hypothetical protein [Tannerellaceae bacterium]